MWCRREERALFRDQYRCGIKRASRCASVKGGVTSSLLLWLLYPSVHNVSLCIKCWDGPWIFHNFHFSAVTGLVFPALSLFPWTDKTFASWNRIHTKSAGKPMAHGGSIVHGFFLSVNDSLSTSFNTAIGLCVSHRADGLLFPFNGLLLRVSTCTESPSLLPWPVSEGWDNH